MTRSRGAAGLEGTICPCPQGAGPRTGPPPVRRIFTPADQVRRRCVTVEPAQMADGPSGSGIGRGNEAPKGVSCVFERRCLVHPDGTFSPYSSRGRL